MTLIICQFDEKKCQKVKKQELDCTLVIMVDKEEQMVNTLKLV